MRTIDVGIGTITHLAVSPDGSQIAAAGKRGIGLGPWPALAKGRGPFAVHQSPDTVAQIAWHPSGRVFAAACADSFVQIWTRRLTLSHEFGDLPGQQGPMLAVAYSLDGEQLAFGGGWQDQPGCALIMRAHIPATLLQLQPHASEVGSIVFLRNDVVATGSMDGNVTLHCVDKPSELFMAKPLRSRVHSLARQPNGDRLAIAAGNSTYFRRIATDGRSLLADENVCRGHKHAVRAVSFSPDGRLLATVGEDGALRFWDTESGATSMELDLGLKALRAVAFSPDGLTVAAGGDAGTIAIVDVDP